jgi:AcrR family transcriptional regulator
MSTSPPPNSSFPHGQRRFRGLAPEERQSQRRSQIMEAALDVFGTRGFHQTGVRDICAQAKLTERYFYESFQNREALFLAVYEAATQRIAHALLSAVSAQPPGADITHVGLRAVLTLFKDDPRIARVVLIEVLTIGSVESAFQVSQGFAETIEQLATALYPDLTKHRLQARILANGLYGATIYIAQRWALDGFREPLEEILEHSALFYDALAMKMGVAAAPPPKTRAQKRARKPRRTR